MFINHKVVYVPLTKDLLYPVYVPVVIDDEDILRSSGRLSRRDYDNTISLNNKAGFPIAPLLAALAPVVIPGVIKGIKKLINKSNGVNDKSLSCVNDKSLSYVNDELNYKSVNSNGISGQSPISGYIPTNPNIKTLKQLQELYDKYD